MPDRRRTAFAAVSAVHACQLQLRGVSAYRPGSAADLVTTVMRLSAPRLADVVAALSVEFPDHYWYPPSDLHVTVFGLRGAVEPARLASLLEDEPTMHATIRGLALSRETVYARVYADRGRLSSLRRRLGHEFGVPLRRLGLDLAHANIGRLRTSDVGRLRRRVRGYRSTDLGTATFDTILLTRTDKVFSAAQTATLGSFPLEPR